MLKDTGNTKKQNKNRGIIICLVIVLALLAMVVAAAVYVLGSYHIVGGRFYDKNTAVLNLLEEEIKPSHYDKIREKMPDCEIRWNIPFQGGNIPSDVTEITITNLSEKDIAILDYAQKLTTVQAEGCTDYEALEQLQQQRPEVDVNYSIAFSTGGRPWDVERLELSGITEEDISLLRHLPNLKAVVLTDGSNDQKMVEALKKAAEASGLEFGVQFLGEIYTTREESVEVEGITDEGIAMLHYFGNLKNLQLKNPTADPEKIIALENQLSGVTVSWKVTLGDQHFDSQTTVVDLTMVEVRDLAEVEQKMQYLPNLEQVTFGLCGVDNPEWGNSRSKLTASPIRNEDLAAYRDRVRGNYKVVWTVRLGPSIALATDKDNFMPNHFGVGQLPDDYAYNLRYCEEMVCLDVGHMTLTDISFVEYMPNLKYLILAWTEVQYIEPIRTCKNLVFLELDNSCIRDISPLVDCTALEDLNLGNTWCDITPVTKMPWLKNVYMILRGNAGVVGMALPDTRVVTSNDPEAATVGYGWRRLPNYYAMRDCLHVPYMN